MKDKIRSLLGAGISPALVASAVGCTESYISQLLSSEDFALEVAQLRCAEVESVKIRDSKWDTLEDAFLEKLENLLPLFLRPRDVLQALVVINNAKRRASAFISDGVSGHTINNVVVLQLPTQTVREFSLNTHNEIIEVDKRALVAMPTSALLKELQQTNDDSREIPAFAIQTVNRAQERVLDENSV